MDLLQPKSCNQLGDSALVEALGKDNREAFAEIYERYWSRLFWVFYRKLKAKEVAEELVQDLFISLWNKRATTQIENLEHYLFSAVKYRIIDYIRAQLTRESYSVYYKAFISIENHETEETVAVNDLTFALEESIDKLPEKSREVFRLSRLEHRSIREIAKLLNLSEKAVEYHLTKALKMLRGHLKDFVAVFFFLIQK